VCQYLLIGTLAGELNNLTGKFSKLSKYLVMAILEGAVAAC